jgi:hypothetical protein
VNPNAYNALLKAVSTGRPSDFNLIPLGGTVSGNACGISHVPFLLKTS